MNTLYYGDNLFVLREYIQDESVDLVYLDPPFNSNADYNVLFAERDGSQAASQIKAFEDTWRWNAEAARAYQETVEEGGKLSQAMQAFRMLLGDSDMFAYLAMMAPRLKELHRVLKPTGSLYLHCDPTASHYLKILLDAVFDPKSFRNEVIWKRTSAHSGSKRWGPVHDVLLFYAKSLIGTWNTVFQEYSEEYLSRFYRFSDESGQFRIGDLTGAGTRRGDSGKPWRDVDPTRAGRHWAVPNKAIKEIFGEAAVEWSIQKKLEALDSNGLIYWPPKGKVPQFKRYLNPNAGVPITDVIADISPISAQAAERLGYPTQKPLALLDRIIQASSNEGDLVLDPFCGCGTTIDAAERLNRRWIGIDITHLAINLIKHRLQDTHGEEIAKTYEVIGEPMDVSGARELAESEPYQFQWWALGLVGARPTEQKKGADKGIDGRLYFHDDPSSTKTKQVIFSVKAGKVMASHVRDLRGVIEREKAEIGVLISMNEPTQPMKKEAASAGFYESPWGKHPRLQLLTVEELLEGGRIDMPAITGINVTHKRAKRHHKGEDEQMGLPGHE